MKLIILSTLFILCGLTSSYESEKANMLGAWQSGTAERRMVRIYSEAYFSVSIYSEENKTYESTEGGSWMIEGDQLVETYEFSTVDSGKIGKTFRTTLKSKGKQMELIAASGTTNWEQLDDGHPGVLAGAWLITGRVVNGEKTTRKPGPRKTMKILSGTRFQWIAYNVDTKEFFGTGGGTYTTVDGKYTEHIEFFSRDNSRVGMDLSFDYSLEDGDWRHNGLSSKGDPIDEVWSKRERLDAE